MTVSPVVLKEQILFFIVKINIHFFYLSPENCDTFEMVVFLKYLI